MSRVSGIEISSSQGLKKPQNSSQGLILRGVFNPQDEEISIPDTIGHSEYVFLYESIYAMAIEKFLYL